MRDASGRPGREVLVCEGCGTTVVTAMDGLFRNPAVGSARRFSSPACRSAAHRRRRAGVAEDAPRQLRGGRGRVLGGPGGQNRDRPQTCK